MQPPSRRPVHHHRAEDYTWGVEHRETRKPTSKETKAKLGSAAVDKVLDEIDALISEVTQAPQLSRMKGAGAPPKAPPSPNTDQDQFEQVSQIAAVDNSIEQRGTHTLAA